MHLTAPPQADTPSRVDWLLDEAHRIRHLDTAKALRLCTEAESLALRLDYQHGLAYARLRRALCLSVLGEDAEASMQLIKQAQIVFETLGDLKGVGEASNLLASLHVTRDDLDAALALHHQALQARRQAGDRSGEAGSLNNLGLLYRSRGQFADALQYLFMSLELAREAELAGAQAYACANIGATLGALGDSSHAMAYLHEGLALVRQTQDHSCECSILTHQGEILTETGHWAEAQAHLLKAAELARSTGNVIDTAEVLLAQARVQQLQGQLGSAAGMLNDSLVLMRRMRHRRGEAEVVLALGRNDSLAGQPEAALVRLGQALDLLQGLQADLTLGRLHELISQIHEQRGDCARALHHFKAFYGCQQRIHNQDSQRRIRALLQRAALEQLQLDADQARARGDRLAQALELARVADQEKEALLNRLSQQSDLLRQLAREDGLTGLANRRWLDAQLGRERERARRHGHPLAVAMIDLDHFKSINDRFSHRVGDEVLRRLGLLLRDAVRSSDIVGRYGGEEFMVVLVETSVAHALVVCEKLRQRVAELHLSDLHPELSGVTVSIGLAGDLPDPVAQDPVLLADQQLYRAKAMGRNQVCWLAAGAANQQQPNTPG